MGDPWLFLTAFGFVASAGLLVYLVRQLNAASDEEEETSEPETEPAAQIPEPVAVAAPPPPPPPTPLPAEPGEGAQRAGEGRISRPQSELSPAVAFIKALHEDIQTFHWEMQAIKKKLERFEENQEKQMAALVEKLNALEKAPRTPPSGTA